MKYLKNQKGIGLRTIIIIIAIIIAIMFIAEMVNDNSYREEQRQKIISYNEKIVEYNEVIKTKNQIVEQYPYIGVSFKEAKSVPESIADDPDIDSIYDKLMAYQNENNEIVDYNEEQLEIGKKNINQRDLQVQAIKELLQDYGL